MKNYKRLIVLCVVEMICIFIMVALCQYGGVFNKIFVKIGVVEPTQDTIDYTLVAWERSLQKMNYDADVVFFGDSLTEQSDFQKYFPDVKIVELGLGGDTITMCKDRAQMVAAVTPEKIFVLVGINRLRADKVKPFERYYNTLITTLMDENPNADIYIQSLLPVSEAKEGLYCPNAIIDEFNTILLNIAKSRGIKYIDLNSEYKVNGFLNPEWTTDGVHLTEKGYDVWAQIIREYL